MELKQRASIDLWTLTLIVAAIITIGAIGVHTARAQAANANTTTSTATTTPATTTTPQSQSTMPTVPLLLQTAAQTPGESSSTATSTSPTTTPAMNMPTTTTATQPSSSTGTTAPQVVQISENGDALIRGTVQAVGTDSVIINTWGGIWIALTTPNTAITAPGTPNNTSNASLSDIHVGEYVGVAGTVSTNEVYTVDADTVYDYGVATSTPTTGTQTGTLGVASPGSSPGQGSTSTSSGSFPTSVSASGVTRYSGNISQLNPSAGTFALSDGIAGLRLVHTGAGTTYADTFDNGTSLAQMQNGDRVYVDAAPLSDGSLAALAIQDLTVGLQNNPTATP